MLYVNYHTQLGRTLLMLYVNYHTQLGRTLLMFLVNPSRIVSEYIFVSPGNSKISNAFFLMVCRMCMCVRGGEAMLRFSYRLLPTIRLPFSLSLLCVCVLFFSFLIARPEHLYMSALRNVKHNTQDQKVPT